MEISQFLLLWLSLSISIAIMFLVPYCIYIWADKFFETSICEYELYDRYKEKRWQEAQRAINYRAAIEKVINEIKEENGHTSKTVKSTKRNKRTYRKWYMGIYLSCVKVFIPSIRPRIFSKLFEIKQANKIGPYGFLQPRIIFWWLMLVAIL